MVQGRQPGRPAHDRALGFLSYTRRDDQFFGGYITAFREALEAGVQVVTGDRGFRLFQDVEGIVIGEQWEKKLAEVIGRASFFLPMLSPLFLQQPELPRGGASCSSARERPAGRDDLILPVYLVDSPKLEKAEERDQDPVATEIAKRQRYDWRENAWLPLDEPAARTGGPDAGPGDRDGDGADRPRRRPATPWRPAPGLSGSSRARPTTRRHGADRGGRRRRRAWSGPASVWCSGSTTAPRTMRWERAALESYGVRFTLARSDQRGAGRCCARAASRRSSPTWAGRASPRPASTCCSGCVTGAARQPYFLYTSARAAKALDDVEGAQGVTADPDQLVAMVVAAVR